MSRRCWLGFFVLSALVSVPACDSGGGGSSGADSALLDPSQATETAPETFRARFETTKGNFVVEVKRQWAPHGADRLFNLVKIGFFEDVAFFRVVEGFVVQWGIHGNPKVAGKWAKARLPVDPVVESNRRGTLTYAMAGRPDTRATQLFINFKDNTNLDGMGFAPVGTVVEGMDVVEQLHSGYGNQPSGEQGKIQSKGNEFLRKHYPELDYIQKASIVP